MGFILLIVSTILKIIIAPFAYVYGAISSALKSEFDSYNKSLAIAKDHYGNGLCKYLFNALLITKDGYRFGNIDETISSVIGKNKIKGTLTVFGKILDSILNLFDKNHSIKSIDNTIYDSAN